MGVPFSSLRLRFSPVGESLSFASPKESNQRKGDPWCVGLRLPCVARRPGRRGNSPFGLRHPAPLFPGRLRYSATHKGHPCGRQRLEPNTIYVMAPPELPPSALPIWRVRTGKERNRVRAPQHGAFCAPCQGELVERPPVRAKSGTRRAAMWGRLFFGHFLLAKQKKVTRPQAKSEASAITKERQP